MGGRNVVCRLDRDIAKAVAEWMAANDGYPDVSINRELWEYVAECGLEVDRLRLGAWAVGFRHMKERRLRDPAYQNAVYRFALGVGIDPDRVESSRYVHGLIGRLARGKRSIDRIIKNL